jgi:hypothetical protein
MKATMPKPRRRWFRLSLRTMFVVLTAFSLWIVWQAKIVRDRKHAIHSFEAVLGEPSQIPVWRRWMVDRSVRELYVSPAYPDKQWLRRLFPEATLHDVPPPVLGSVWPTIRPRLVAAAVSSLLADQLLITITLNATLAVGSCGF